MTSKILLKRNTQQGKAPSAADLSLGELAVNTADQRIYFRHTDNTVNYIQSIYTSSINDLADVEITSAPDTGNALAWDSVLSKWVPTDVSPPLTVVKVDENGDPDDIVTKVTNINFSKDFTVTDLGNGVVGVRHPFVFNKIIVADNEDLLANDDKSLEVEAGVNIELSTLPADIRLKISTILDPSFNTVSLNPTGYLVFGDGSQQVTKAPRIYTNADAEQGLTLEDLVPGDYYYDDISESIYIMIDTGLGFNDLLDLTVRA